MDRKDRVTLSQKEQTRLRVITEVGAGRWPVPEAVQALGLSPRHVRRLRRRLAGEGAQAFTHGNRGRPSVHRFSDDVRAKVVELGAGRHAACNDTRPRELLFRDESIVLGRASVERLRRQAGQKPKQRRRPPRHRSRRYRLAPGGAPASPHASASTSSPSYDSSETAASAFVTRTSGSFETRARKPPQSGRGSASRPSRSGRQR